MYDVAQSLLNKVPRVPKSQNDLSARVPKSLSALWVPKCLSAIWESSESSKKLYASTDINIEWKNSSEMSFKQIIIRF